MQWLLDRALADPWAALEFVLDGPLHPGGRESTASLLDRAGVDSGVRLLDVGCGSGRSVALARERGARAVGVDHDPPAGAIRGDLASLPVRDGGVDVVLAECAMCLVPERTLAFAEAQRVLPTGGRLALSDVVVEGSVPDVPDPISRAVCLDQTSSRATLVDSIEEDGFEVGQVRDHREDLLAMRDTIADRVDYERLLGQLGVRGERILDGIQDVERGVEEGCIGYVSLVATAE